MSSETKSPYLRPQGTNAHPSPPVSFTSGVLDGLTIRIEIKEIQKADIGRKYGLKDKRPIEPPPVVICSFVDLTNSHPQRLRAQPLSIETAAFSAVCHVDLFTVPSNVEEYTAVQPPAGFKPQNLFSQLPSDIIPPILCASSSIISPSAMLQRLLPLMPSSRDAKETSLPSFSSFHPTTAGNYSQTPPSLHPSSMVPVHSQGIVLPGVQSLVEAGQLPGDDQGHQMRSPEPGPDDIVAWFGSHPIRESDKCSTMLAGATFVQAEIVDYHSKKEAMFVFPDLAVRAEGTFVLRYRTMNLASLDSPSLPFRILAECFGGPFKIYSAKGFPGLPPSTALTKLLSMYGIRVNVRENERKRRTREQIDAGVKLTGVAVPFDGRGGDGLGLAQTSAAGGSTTPTQIMLYPPTSTTSGPSSVAATEQHDRARPHGLSDSCGFSSAMYDGMEVDEWDDY